MNKASLEIPETQLEKLMNKNFIEWLIENLTPDEMLFILGGIGIEAKRVKGKNPPKLFLKNKLLIKATRAKLRDTEVFPPFKWIMNIEGEITKENLIAEAEKSTVPKREKALALFLQNYYDEALELYEIKNGEGFESGSFDETVAAKENLEINAVVEETRVSPKLEKKLAQKLTNLEAERDKLQNQLKELQLEMKEKLSVKQNEINRLNGLLVNEKNTIEKVMKKALADAEAEKEVIIEEVNFLKEENDKLKLKIKMEPIRQHEIKNTKAKIALLGDPKNKSILKNNKYDIEVFEHENFSKLIDREAEFDLVYLLTWRFSVEEFNEQKTSEVSEKTKPLVSFKELRKKLEEPLNVN